MPTKWPCPEAIDCPCADGNPLGNFSSEAPDPFTHFARFFYPNPVQIDDPPGVFTTPACGATCVSPISNEDAFACAFREAVMCTNPPAPPDPDDPPLFGNRATSCTADCAEGEDFTLTVPAGTYLARTQELADAIAKSFCEADVIKLRHCDMPGPGPNPNPNTPCPHIGSTFPASPVNLIEGDDTLLSANYTYSGSGMLMFVWYVDGFPVYSTMNATLPLIDVQESDSGDYVLGIFAPGCFPVFSSPITVVVASSCPPEVGNDAPATLDIIHTTNWETFTIDNPDLSPVLSSNAICNPTGLLGVTPANGLDHPPGVYGFRYVTGYVGGAGFGCPPLTPIFGTLDIYQLADGEANIDAPVVCNFQGLAHECRTLAGDPPPSGNFGGGITVCGTNSADVISQLQAFWSGKAFVCDPYPPDNALDFSHGNNGGQFIVYFNDSGVPIIVPIQIMVIQLSGQIPQPRKLRIDNFGTVAAQFTDPAIAANWDGTFPIRTTFSSAAVQWDAASSGGFGGARITWINNHPTSTNGYGWRISIYGAGPTLVWTGLKGVDETSEGTYYRDDSMTPNGPACLSCSDDSATGWSPP